MCMEALPAHNILTQLHVYTVRTLEWLFSPDPLLSLPSTLSSLDLTVTCHWSVSIVFECHFTAVANAGALAKPFKFTPDTTRIRADTRVLVSLSRSCILRGLKLASFTSHLRTPNTRGIVHQNFQFHAQSLVSGELRGFKTASDMSNASSDVSDSKLAMSREDARIERKWNRVRAFLKLCEKPFPIALYWTYGSPWGNSLILSAILGNLDPRNCCEPLDSYSPCSRCRS